MGEINKAAKSSKGLREFNLPPTPSDGASCSASGVFIVVKVKVNGVMRLLPPQWRSGLTTSLWLTCSDSVVAPGKGEANLADDPAESYEMESPPKLTC